MTEKKMLIFLLDKEVTVYLFIHLQARLGSGTLREGKFDNTERDCCKVSYGH